MIGRLVANEIYYESDITVMFAVSLTEQQPMLLSMQRLLKQEKANKEKRKIYSR